METFKEEIDLETPKQKDEEEIKEREEEQDYGEKIFGIIQKEIDFYRFKYEVNLKQRLGKEKCFDDHQKDLKKIKEGQEAIAEKIKAIENFKQENPEIYKEFLKKVKSFSLDGEKNFSIDMKNSSRLLNKVSEAGICEAKILYPLCEENDKELNQFFILESLVKIETINPPRGIREIADKQVEKNKWIEYSYVKDFIDINPSEKDIKVLERLNELNIGSLCDFSQKQFIEKKDKIYYVLLNDEKFPSFANQFNQLKEICERKPTTSLLEDVRVIVEGEAEAQGLFSKETQDVLEKLATPEIKGILDNKETKEFIKRELNHYEIYQEIMRWVKPPELLEKFLKNEIKKTNGIYEKYPDNLNSSSFIVGKVGNITEKIKKSPEKFQKIFQKYNFEIKEENDLDALQNLSCEELDKFLSKASQDMLLDLGIKKTSWQSFQELSKLSAFERGKIIMKDFSDPSLKKKLAAIIEHSSFYNQISKQFTKNIRKTKGDYQAKTFSPDLLENISLSLTLFYLIFKNPNKEDIEKLNKENLEKLKEKGLESETHKKIYNKICSGVLELKDIIPGRKATKKMIEKGNLEYLLTGQKLDIPFDYYGVLGKDLEEMKKEVDARAEELIEDYSENKEKYLPYLDSLLGYASKYKEEVQEILNVEDLWEYKFSHLNDLNLILSKIKDIEMEIGEGKREKENIELYVKNLEEHLDIEEFSKAKERISAIKERNQEKALRLIEKMESVVSDLKQEKNPEKKDIDTLLSNKAIFKHLGLVLSLESVKQMYQKINQKEEYEEKEEFLKSVEIIKEPEEYLGAMNMNPSCMRVGGQYEYGALTIAQAPILILGVKDNFGKIQGRSLLIPVEDEKGKYRFELKNTYGVGEEYIKDFTEKIERKLKEKNSDYYKETEQIITIDFIEGELPKSKKLPSTSRFEFYRDGKGLVEFEEID